MRPSWEANSRSARIWTYYILRNPTLTGLSHGLNESSPQTHSTHFAVTNTCLAKAVIPRHIFRRKPLQIFSPTLLELIIRLLGDVSKSENNRPAVFFLLDDSPAPEFYMPFLRNTVCTYTAYEDGIESVPKRRYIKFRSQGIAQKKEYNIQNTAKVWNQEETCFFYFNSKIFLVLHTFVPRTSGNIIFH